MSGARRRLAPLSRADLFEFLTVHGACCDGMARAERSRGRTARGVYLSTVIDAGDIWYLGDLCCWLGSHPPSNTLPEARRSYPWSEIEPRIRVGLAAARKARRDGKDRFHQSLASDRAIKAEWGEP